MKYKVVLESKVHDRVLTYEEAMKLKAYLENLFSDVKVEVIEVVE